MRQFNGTHPWIIFGEGPTRIGASGHKIEEHTKIVYTNTDVRFTKKSDTEFFAIVMDDMDWELKIKSLCTMLGELNTDILSVELLGSDVEIEWNRNEDGLVIMAPKEYPTKHAHAFKIKLEGYKERDIDWGM